MPQSVTESIENLKDSSLLTLCFCMPCYHQSLCFSQNTIRKIFFFLKFKSARVMKHLIWLILWHFSTQIPDQSFRVERVWINTGAMETLIYGPSLTLWTLAEPLIPGLWEDLTADCSQKKWNSHKHALISKKTEKNLQV